MGPKKVQGNERRNAETTGDAMGTPWGTAGDGFGQKRSVGETMGTAADTMRTSGGTWRQQGARGGHLRKRGGTKKKHGDSKVDREDARGTREPPGTPRKRRGGH